MPLDAVLRLQHGIDRVIRRLRRGAAPTVTRRRFLIVQIDGLSHAVLEQALASGYAPFLKQLLRRHGYRLEPMSVGMPTSTPPFRWRRCTTCVPTSRAFTTTTTARAKPTSTSCARDTPPGSRPSTPRAGCILQGGSAYDCVFTGGADSSLFIFVSLTRPSGRGLAAAVSPFVVLAWVCLKSGLRAFIELARALPRFADIISWRTTVSRCARHTASSLAGSRTSRI